MFLREIEWASRAMIRNPASCPSTGNPWSGDSSELVGIESGKAAKVEPALAGSALPVANAAHILASLVLQSRARGRLSSRQALGICSGPPRSLRLEAQDVALSRLKHRFESGREHHL